jgi:hypothetical protein
MWNPDPSTRLGRLGRLVAVTLLGTTVLPVALTGSAAPAAAAPPPDASIYYSTATNTNPTGVPGTGDDADIYSWNGTATTRAIDATAAPYNVPSSANVDGFSRVDATHFYVSFTDNVTLAGAGTVADEDVVYYNAGTWSLWFDGSARGVGSTDLDAISVVGTSLYFSTDNTAIPTGVAGGGDDADIYRWDGTAFTRVIDATATGWSSSNVDALVWRDAAHLLLSYSTDTSVPGPLGVQDEDVVAYVDGAWSVYFNGTGHGLNQFGQDLDALSLPDATAQAITFGALAARTMGDADFNVGATASSGLPVGFSATGSCTVAGTLVHITGAGSCTVTASQPGDFTYAAATDVAQSFPIAKGDQTISFGPLADRHIYSPDFALTATASSGLSVDYAASGVCTIAGGRGHLTGTPGTCTITASQAGDVNWNAAAPVIQSFDVAFVTPTAELWAVSGSTTVAGQAVNVLGYSTSNTPVVRPGGPTITVTQGSEVILVVHNTLTESTSLVVRGQQLPTDQTGAGPGGTTAYTFTPSEVGTFIYEAGPIANSQHQVAMGLFGALVVNPTSGSAYGSDQQAVVLISDIDPALNNSANPAGFDMRSYAPKYTLVNGAVYPSSANLAEAAPGDDVLLRYVNAGINYHSMSVLGANQRIVADDGHALAQPYSVVAQTVGPGQTFDAVVHVSPSQAPGTKLSVFDASLKLRNRNRRPATSTATVTYGGALAFVSVSGTVSTTDSVGPVVSNLSAGATTITASISDATTGGGAVDAAEYFIDTAGAAGSGTPMTGSFGTTTVAVTATHGALTPGNHTVYVRGRDGAGNWGPLVSTHVSSDAQGPASTGLSLTPNPTNGTLDVALHATGSDVATGGSNVTAGEYSIDGGAASAMTVNLAATTVSLDATIPSATLATLAEGPHTVSVRAQDAASNWGSAATITLTIDTTGPATTGVTVTPTPNNGTLGVNSSTPAVRLSATVADTTTKLDRAEGFIDAVGANGSGFLFVPVDGVMDTPSEGVSVDIPLSTIAALTPGNHTLYVHGRDAAGNWGPAGSTVLVIDKTAPTPGAITRADPSPTSATSVSFTVTFSEPVTGVTAANFTLVQGAGLSGSTISAVTGTGASRTVTVSTGSGGGTLGLNLASATGIRDVANNALPSTGLPVVGQVYTLISPPLYFSTAGNSSPPGLTGGDDADIYYWSGTAFSRSIDASGTGSLGLPSSANVDGFDRVSATHFFMSFSGTVSVPGLGSVQDEDVVEYNAGTWTMFFDGNVRGLNSNTDLDAISIVGGTLYFSTADTLVPPGAGGPGDDADIYRWNGGSSYTRMIDASTRPGWSTANVDGLVWIDATHVYLSFSVDTTVGSLGVQDEDVVALNGTAWSVYFDGTGKNLTTSNLDVDAFDLP